MKVEVKKISLENYKKFPSKSVDLFPRTEISGRNREGKSTLQDAYLDVLTGKMANGTEPTSIRRKENGLEVPKVDVIRELTLAIDGKEKVIRKITKQKWRKPRGQSERYSMEMKLLMKLTDSRLNQRIIPSSFNQ